MKLNFLKLQLIYHYSSSKTLLIKIFFLSTIMALIPCLSLVYPINDCDHPFTFQKSNVRMSASDLQVAFVDSMAGNWLIRGQKPLIIGGNSVRAVMVMRKLGFSHAIGVDRKGCSSLVKRGDLYKLPFKEASFDFVFSTATIDGVRVPARMVVEMERVLKPGRVGVVLRHVSGRVPDTAVMKAAAPVASYLKLSDVVGVRTVNCTVMVVFKKRLIGIRDEIEKLRAEGIAPLTLLASQSDKVIS